MAARFDAAARLAEGRPVVDDLIEYVAACRQLGYHHSELTAHATQVAEWYGGQNGLDLAALDADAAALRAAAAGTADVTREQASAATALQDGWAGSGGGAAVDFLTRHQRAAESMVAGVRNAADALTALHDDLWRAVDAQVAATLDAGAAAQRETWLAASRTLTTGDGDRATASELVDREVKPFVDNVIGGRWIAAMRAASEAVAGAYEAALARLSGSGPTAFEVPFDFGPHTSEAAAPQAVVPRAVPAPSPDVSAPVTPAAFSPHTAGAPPAAAAPSSTSAPLSAPMESGLGMPAASTPSIPSLPSLGESGGMGSGASGFGTGLADLLGGFGGSSDAGEFEPEQVDTEPAELEEDEPDEEEGEEGQEDEGEEEEDDEAVVEPGVTEDAAPVPVPEPAPTPPPVEPLAAPLPPPPPAEAPPERTPCEIAADELPQVGE